MLKHNEWLLFAEEDLKAAKRMLYHEEVILGPALYHTQQCAEKALKAYLIFKQQPLRRIHDLVELTHLCTEIDHEFSSLITYAVDLNPYVTKARYPDNFYSMPDVSIAQANIQQTEKILDFVKNKIESY